MGLIVADEQFLQSNALRDDKLQINIQYEMKPKQIIQSDLVWMTKN